ncbi:hypothetical protein KUV50_00480 [Membranicola marinus]|uniref:Cytochrome c domain-containing protein n=1 Tax=Membranihabitans marinus TaxID=1227546 RepID=A0A953HIR0_9BACT|nr:hypothetical protein [Membranihabitans marinus]MBY5956589.1 hypothetical protein [Membranihabitans marinus]
MALKFKMNRKGWLAVFAGLLLFAACESDPVLTGDEVSYAGDIRPLIDQNCTFSGCHGAGSVQFELLTYNQVKLKAAAIRREVWELQNMPKDRTMSLEKREKFKDWVDAGAPNN